MDSRPSELDPYPRSERDLGSAVLWARSLTARTGGGSAPAARVATRPARRARRWRPAPPSSPPPCSPRWPRRRRQHPGVTKAEIAQKAATPRADADGPVVLRRHRRGRGRGSGAAADPRRRDLRAADRGRGQAVPARATSWRRPAWSTPRRGPSCSARRSGTSTTPSSSGHTVMASARHARRRLRRASAPRPAAPISPTARICATRSRPRRRRRAPSRRPHPHRPSRRRCRPAAAAARRTGASSRRSAAAPSPSPYGDDRGDHIHSGEDIAAPTGTTVRAANCGTVSISGTESGYGEMVCIRHAGATTTCYAHLSERDVAVNDYVKAGQKIGEVGCTGNCTGPHVHFEVRLDGKATDPAPYLTGAKTVQGQSAPADHRGPARGPGRHRRPVEGRRAGAVGQQRDRRHHRAVLAERDPGADHRRADRGRIVRRRPRRSPHRRLTRAAQPAPAQTAPTTEPAPRPRRLRLTKPRRRRPIRRCRPIQTPAPAPAPAARRPPAPAPAAPAARPAPAPAAEAPAPAPAARAGRRRPAPPRRPRRPRRRLRSPRRPRPRAPHRRHGCPAPAPAGARRGSQEAPAPAAGRRARAGSAPLTRRRPLSGGAAAAAPAAAPTADASASASGGTAAPAQ